MRKVTFEIDDKAFFKKSFMEESGMTEEKAESILADIDSFICTYSLIGGCMPDRYELTDRNGQEMNINDLNGYQKGVVLNDCYAYYVGGKYHGDAKEPCGVIRITETEV